MSGNFQEDFQFLLKNLSDKNESSTNKEEQAENKSRTRKALINIINIYLTDYFDKKFDSVTALFHMVELYIKQHIELFIEPSSSENELSIFLINRMLMILSNPEIRSLHTNSLQILEILSETFFQHNEFSFVKLVIELVLTLQDLLEFDKEFYDQKLTESKKLNRFELQIDAAALDITIDKKWITIDRPASCACLQYNITYVLEKLSPYFVDRIDWDAYEMLWMTVCHQLKIGDFNLKLKTLELALCILDTHLSPLKIFELSEDCFAYFIDCLIAILELIITDFNGYDLADMFKDEKSKSDYKRELSSACAEIINRVFNNNRSQIVKNIELVKHILVVVVETIKLIDFATCSIELVDSLFQMVFNFILVKIEDHLNVDWCDLHGICEYLIAKLGETNKNILSFNLLIAHGLYRELEDENLKLSQSDSNSIEKFANESWSLKFELSHENIQSIGSYKSLYAKAKEFLQNHKTLPSNSQEFKLKSNGLISILDILSLAGLMCQSDPIFIEEYKNVLVEGLRFSLFPSNNSSAIHHFDSSLSTESVYLQLILYWIGVLNDSKNLSQIYVPYVYALHTVKSIYLSSVEWKKSLALNIVALLSLPWLANETSGYDLDVTFKDKSYRQCSSNLIQATPKSIFILIQRYCIQLLCLLPKNICSQWRTNIISKCLREDSDESVRICAINYLPYLIYFLGVSANSLVFSLIHPSMNTEKSLRVMCSYAHLVNKICCLVSRKSICIRNSTFKSTFQEKRKDDGNTEDMLLIEELSNMNMNNLFDLVCTCCDRRRIEDYIIPRLNKRKNVDMMQILLNRPKNVDSQVLIQFMYILSGSRSFMLTTENSGENSTGELIKKIKVVLAQSLPRAFHHIEFSRHLNQQSLMKPLEIGQISRTGDDVSAGQSSLKNNQNLTAIYKESIGLLNDDSLRPIVRFNFARMAISNLICNNLGTNSASNNQAASLSASGMSASTLNTENMNRAISKSIFRWENANDAMQSDVDDSDEIQLDHNLNLEMRLCEGLLRSKGEKNQLDILIYTIGLGRLALSLNTRKPDEYVFVCIKHLLEIINDTCPSSSSEPNENYSDDWNQFCCDMARRELSLISKNINMQSLLTEFEEQVCEIVADSVFKNIQTVCERSISRQNYISTSSYLQSANQLLRGILKVFNYTDSTGFIRTYQRYLVPFLIHRATQVSSDELVNKSNKRIISKSIEFLARKLNSNVNSLIEDTFPYIFTYTTLHSKLIGHVFQYITNDIGLDIDKLINYNKQKILNELLSKCGQNKYKQDVWHSVCVLTAVNTEEATAIVSAQIDDRRIIKSIESTLLAVLVHFDMCLLKSSINLKEKCQVLESLNVLMGMLGPQLITQVRYKLMTTLKLAMKQCSRLSELNCKLWDTFLRNIDKTALGAILNQVSVNLLQLLEQQPYKISKIFEYLIIQNKEHLQPSFNELYFLPTEHPCLQQVNKELRKYTDMKYIIDQINATSNGINTNSSSNSIKALIYLIKQYVKGAMHENADLRVKALEKLYSLLKDKNTEIIFLIERQENVQIISEIMIALLNGCRDSDDRVKILCGSCFGEIGAIDPAYFMTSINAETDNNNGDQNPNSSMVKKVQNSTFQALNSTSSVNTTSNTTINSSIHHSSSSTILMSSTELLMNPSLVSDDSTEFSENFSYSLIIELSKAYLAARNTHEQDSASYAIQECLKIYGCSLTSGASSVQNTKLWNSFPDYFKEILIPLQTSKYEIQSFDNLGLLKTPIILSECKTYEEWVYKWCAYLISKIDTHFGKSTSNESLTDKELKVFPKLQFIIRYNSNVALLILPYVIIKMIIYSNSEITQQIYEEIMSVIQLNKICNASITPSNPVSSSIILNTTSNTASVTAGNSSNSACNNKQILQYHQICCQTVFNIYDHLVRQLNHYRTKMNESMAASRSKSSASARASIKSPVDQKYKEMFEQFNKFIQHIPHEALSKAAFECKAYCRSLMHYELHIRSIPGAVKIHATSVNIKQEYLIELQNLYASMDEIDAASGILLLKSGSEESLADAAFRHKIYGRVNESIACIEQMLESNANAKSDLKQHETYIKTFISIGRHRNALNYLEGLMADKPEWKETLDSYRVETCWKLGSWDKLKQIVNYDLASSKVDSSLMEIDENMQDYESLNLKLDENKTETSKSNLINVISSSLASTFNASVGKLFILVTERDEKQFRQTLTQIREQQIGPLSAASMDAGGNSYQRGYEYLVNLQALQEIENCLGDLLRLRSNDLTEREQYRNLLTKNLDSMLIEPWEKRVLIMQPSFKHLEPIYTVRIALLNFLSSHLNLDLTKQLAKLWLRLAKIARKAGMFENAYQYMLNAQGQIKSNDSNNLEELLVEKSKWYWQREDKDSALFYLQKGLNELFDSNSIPANSDHPHSEFYSKVLLMYTKFGEENGSLDTETIRTNYLTVQKMRKNTEQVHFELAQFTDRLATSISENTGKKDKSWEYVAEIVSYYAMSLEYGCHNIYQSLPRMMSLWLDFGSDYYEYASNASSTNNQKTAQANVATINRNLANLNSILNRVNQTVANALQRIPTFAFLTVYPQLVSRICHPEERVFETLSSIIMKVLFLYQHQAIWMLIAVKNSSVELRKNRCKIIIDKATRQQPDLRKFITDSSELAEKLVQLGNYHVDAGVTQLNLSTHFKSIKRLVEARDFSRLLIPSQFQITLQLPSNETSSANQSNSNTGPNSSNLQSFRSHNPYPLDLVYISCFEENVQVMSSLQKPKRVSIRGTDGKVYSFLCKAKDDLRIDCRIMEFFSVVNKCLKQEPESRRRNLYIRTYAVTPLNENSGIIEWIENLSTMRSILLKLYMERGVGPVTSSEWRQHEDKIRDKEYAIKVYKIFLERYKPTVLYEWFLRTFPEPNSWYNARLNYVRCAAVMSVCGYVLGLGDRHCENIMMASSNGDCIHVDFNCLFNKGETLGVPEIVPFRLTHNMVEAMGPLGYEGIFRKTCEVTLKILREYRDPLTTILKTFIYDPLVEWKTPASTYKLNEPSGETISAKGQLHLQNIICRLKGMHAKQWTTSNNSKVKVLPLSVEGHVNTLIKESTEDRNLGLMYIGWSAFF